MKRLIWFTHKYAIFALPTILLLTVAVMFAEPFKDGDFFWHVKYGEYMLENRTLLPDHTLYSWTPTDNNAVKCNWFADILLHLMHRIGGWPLMFAFRYLCMLTLVLVVWVYARGLGQGRSVLTFFILLIVLLPSYVASSLKPEILSMVFMALVSGLYFSVKASLWSRWGTRPLLFYPFIFLFWVNIHEVFLFGIALLGLITFGELLNYRFNPRCAFKDQGIRHLITGSILSVAVTFITPYGYELNLKLLNLSAGDRPLAVMVVDHYNTIFSSKFANYHFTEYWAIMLILFSSYFLLLVRKRREWDWAILLPTIFLALVFARHVRAAYYWPAFWGLSIIYLRSRVGNGWPNRQKIRVALNLGVIVLFLFLSVRTIYYGIYRPFKNSWFGFGAGILNPEQASSFLKKHRPGKFLYNSYNVGGYLIYDLYPIYKVFCDSRAFPYKEWFEEYYEFNNGPTPLDEFTKKYPFDVALLDYFGSTGAIQKFLLSEAWEPCFYGPSAIVFVRKDMGFGFNFRELDSNRFDELRTFNQAWLVFHVALNLGDLETSRYILELIKEKFPVIPGHGAEYIINVCNLFQDGLSAFAQRNYETAFFKLSILGLMPYAVRANNALVELRNWKAEQYFRRGEYGKALNLIEKTLAAIPTHLSGLYNAGIIGYMIENHPPTKRIESERELMGVSKGKRSLGGADWRSYLDLFLKLSPDNEQTQVARQVLDGKGLTLESPLVCSLTQ
ncbi:MAG: hypothetical protein SV775_02485 [Thermodesulfobacteriota bacterium]|nr:hypothetical protein [Thermodesulfobacteriota bacterium]